MPMHPPAPPLVHVRTHGGHRQVTVSWNRAPWLLEAKLLADSVALVLPATRTQELGEDEQSSEPRVTNLEVSTTIAEGVYATCARSLGLVNPFPGHVDVSDVPASAEHAAHISTTCRPIPDLLPSGALRPVVIMYRRPDEVDLIICFTRYSFAPSVVEALYLALGRCFATATEA
ncbi:MAG: hypothetical protein H0W72_01480 [Planctomycetes bacterium]|nr:hypothetical protein [Planctomycetota bacterium]